MLKFKDEHCDITKSKKNSTRGQGGRKKGIQWQALQHKVDIDNKIICK